MYTPIYKYDCIQDKPDDRDLLFGSVLPAQQLPRIVDLRDGNMPPVFNQGRIGSCVGNAAAALLQYLDHKPDNESVTRSRLWIYYQARVLLGRVNEDCGCMIRDAIKSLNKLGCPSESIWPYDINRFAVEPPPGAYTHAAEAKLGEYQRLGNNELELKSCLAQGQPIILGIQVFQSLESAEVAASGRAPMPKLDERHLGGHAILLVGYNADKREWLARNSWGAHWGQSGYFTLPWEYILNPVLTGDIWTAKSYDFT